MDHDNENTLITNNENKPSGPSVWITSDPVTHLFFIWILVCSVWDQKDVPYKMLEYHPSTASNDFKVEIMHYAPTFCTQFHSRNHVSDTIIATNITFSTEVLIIFHEKPCYVIILNRNTCDVVQDKSRWSLLLW